MYFIKNTLCTLCSFTSMYVMAKFLTTVTYQYTSLSKMRKGTAQTAIQSIVSILTSLYDWSFKIKHIHLNTVVCIFIIRFSKKFNHSRKHVFSISSHTNPEQHIKPLELQNRNRIWCTYGLSSLRFVYDNALVFAISFTTVIRL